MKILFHINCLGRGGAERVVSTLANSFASQGHEVIIATEWVEKSEYELDGRVRRIVVGPKESDLNKGRLSIAYLRIKYLRECIKNEKPDATIAFAKKAGYRLLIANMTNKIPTIVSIRTNPVGTYDTRIDKILIPLLYRRADGCVFQTEKIREYFPNFIQKKSCIIFNPVNSKYLGVKRAVEPQKTIVSSGRIDRFKNQELLVNAFADVAVKHPEYDLYLYGGDTKDGSLEKIENAIVNGALTDKVHICGEKDNLEELIPQHEVYVLSSDKEGMPNALLEAMTMGMPVISTDCAGGGARAVIEDGVNGLLVPAKDREALASAINRLIEDKELAISLGENAARIREQISTDRIIDQWTDYMVKCIQLCK